MTRFPELQQITLADRLALFGITDRTLSVLRRMRPEFEASWPTIGARLAETARSSQAFAGMEDEDYDRLRSQESRHFVRLFTVGFDDGYMEEALELARFEYGTGWGARTRLTVVGAIGAHLLRHIATRNPLWGVGTARLFGEVLRALLLDCSIAMGLHEELARADVAARKQSIEASVLSFNARVDETCAGIAAGAGDLIGAAEALGQAMAEAQARSQIALDASGRVGAAMIQAAETTADFEQVLTAVGADARASGQMGARTAEVTGRADGSVADLTEAVARIGSVTRLIGGIAGQTNLLALNATIEAARAGAAGRGFAVVANEVKTLAGQTARATDEANDHVRKIQAASESSAEALSIVVSSMREQRAISDRIERAVLHQVHQTGAIRDEASQAVTAAGETSDAMRSIQAHLAALERTLAETRMFAETVNERSRGLADELRAFSERMRTA